MYYEELPDDWSERTPQERVEYIAEYSTRAGLLRRVLARTVADPPCPDGEQRVTKEMLVAILLYLRGEDTENPGVRDRQVPP